MTNVFIPTKLKVSLLVIAFSLGKMIGTTGQTLFGVQHAMHYLLHLTHYKQFASPLILSIAGFCTLWVILVTRVPAMYRQFFLQVISNDTTHHKEKHDSFTYEKDVKKRIIYYVLLHCGYACGIFSVLGAYLGAVTLSEYVTMLCYALGLGSVKSRLFTCLFAIFVSSSAFISYYSFNLYKIKHNTQRVLNQFYCQKLSLFLDKNILKTLIVSVMSLISVPFLSYYLTKHAILSIPYLSGGIPLIYIKAIAIFSAITALITSFTTTIPATYEYFLDRDKIKNDDPLVTPMTSLTWRYLRNTTIFAGFIDSTANGLSNFMGVIDVAYDMLNIDMFGTIVILATGSGLSSAFLIATFSVRQGFNDFKRDFSKMDIAGHN